MSELTTHTLRVALKETTTANQRMAATIVTLRAEVLSLQRGTAAGTGFFQASAEALEDVVDACRELVDAQEGEKLEAAIRRKLKYLADARTLALDIGRERDLLKQNLSTLEKVGGVNGLARLTLHAGHNEPLSSAASRAMRELAEATNRAQTYADRIATLEGRIADLERAPTLTPNLDIRGIS
jgi:hypothetical protein